MKINNSKDHNGVECSRSYLDVKGIEIKEVPADSFHLDPRTQSVSYERRLQREMINYRVHDTLIFFRIHFTSLFVSSILLMSQITKIRHTILYIVMK